MNTPYYTKAESDAIEANLRRQYNYGSSEYRGFLTIAQTPTLDGWYWATEIGTYTNAGGLVTLANKINMIEKDGSTFRLYGIDTAFDTENYPKIETIDVNDVPFNQVPDLDISDENGNVIARFENGDIKTKNFDSKEVLDDIVKKVGASNGISDNSDLDFSDENDNVLVRFEKGNIKTKNFDSTEVVDLNKEIQILGVTQELSNVTTGLSGRLYCNDKKSVKDGYLGNVFIYSNEIGNIDLYIGSIDQYQLFIPSLSKKNIPVVAGLNTIDLSVDKLKIKIGETIAIYSSAEAYKVVGTTHIGYISTTTGNIFQTQVSAGSFFNVGFTVNSSDFYNAEFEIKNLQTNVEIVQKKLPLIDILIDEVTQKRYKWKVVSGVPSLQELGFKKVLVFGNSYTCHPSVTDTGIYATTLWWGNQAMASTTPEASWTNLLELTLKESDPSSIVQPVFARAFEQRTKTIIANVADADCFVTWDDSGNKIDFNTQLTAFADADAVCVMMGTNNLYDSDWTGLLTTLTNWIKNKFTTATIYLIPDSSVGAGSGGFYDQWNNFATANNYEFGYTYFQGNDEAIGDYVLGNDGLQHQIDNSGVSGHPNDHGGHTIYELFCSKFGIVANQPLLEITINNNALSVNDTKVVKGSLVTVLSDGSIPSVTVTDTTSTTISNTNKGNGKFTFIMPSTNVTIN